MISAEINELLTEVLPERMVACADLEAPTNHKRGLKAFSADDRGGAYVHCGVREHVMGSMANGMAAHGGIIPLSVTYLAFSDYERPAMRMAALMGLPVKFVFSHDSIGLGRNGPTHQPVEILASLRAMPNMLVLRPADAVEAAECWEAALEHREGPSTLVFARQALPPVRHEHTNDNLSRRGAYVLAEATGGPRAVTLLATGSEVALALQARTTLQAEGIATAVVSMPCWELFDEQDEAYRASCASARRCARGCRGGAALRLGPLPRRARRLRRHDGLRRLGPCRCAVREVRHHAGGHRRRGEALPFHPSLTTGVQPSCTRSSFSTAPPLRRRSACASLASSTSSSSTSARDPRRWCRGWPAPRSPSPTRWRCRPKCWSSCPACAWWRWPRRAPTSSTRHGAPRTTSPSRTSAAMR